MKRIFIKNLKKPKVLIVVFTLIYLIKVFVTSQDRTANEKKLEHDERKNRSSNFIFDFPVVRFPLDTEENVMRFRVERFNSFKNKKNVSGLGEWGQPAYLGKGHKEEIDNITKVEKFNKILGDLISLDRKLGDYRIEQCKSVNYPEKLPNASVVIVFCNEAPSALLRTVHSVINRSPPQYLHEVILVDDASDRDDLKLPLEDHLEMAFPENIVKLIRSDERIGLMRARMVGAERARGEVLIFLDAHCEATDIWLEPLLAHIEKDRRAVVCPLIDLICTSTLGYFQNGGSTSGGFDWNLSFDWMPIQAQEKERRKKETDSIRAPSMAGGLFASDRKFFFELGGYDKGMSTWGVENVEISIRTWMCGGSVELIPCSRVGHMYRSAFPYSTDEKMKLNSKRVAEVWLEDYKRVFYLYHPELKELDAGDVSERIMLKEKLKCKSFKWFLENIFPELFVPDENVKAYGNICLPSKQLCWDTMGNHAMLSSYTLQVFYHQQGKSINQLFSLDMNNRIRKENKCLKLDDRGHHRYLRMGNCNENGVQHIKYLRETGLMLLENGLCIEVPYSSDKNTDILIASNCTSLPNQRWVFEFYLG